MKLPVSVSGKSAFEVGRRACEEAGEVLLGHFHSVNHVKHKGRRDIQTEADLLSEKIILDILGAEFPSDAIVSEESLSRAGASGYKWIVDPLDGTNNYFYGLPYFAVNIALVRDRDRKTLSSPRRRESRDNENADGWSVIPNEVEESFRGHRQDERPFDYAQGDSEYFPGNRERATDSNGEEILLGLTYAPIQKELFWAEKGKGAFLNGMPIHVTETQELKNCLVSFDMGYNEEQGCKMLEVARSIWPRVHSLRLLGSGALGLAYVASGRLGLYFHCYLFPWDVAPGILLVQEAGGVAEAWGRKPITVNSGSVIASSPILIDEFFAAIL